MTGMGQSSTLRSRLTAQQISNVAKEIFKRMDRDKNQKFTQTESNMGFNYLDKDSKNINLLRTNHFILGEGGVGVKNNLFSDLFIDLAVI